MSLTTRHLHVYLDLVSPYSYIAFVRLQSQLLPRYAPRLKITYHPIVFGALLKQFGHLGPGEIPPKRVAMLRDLARSCDKHGMKMGWPKVHPFNSLFASRLVSVPPGDPVQVPLIALFFDAAFGPANLKRYELSADDCRGLVGQAVKEGKLPDSVAREPTEEMKQRLRRTTEGAAARGVFGVPSFVVEGSEEVVWGQDALEGLVARAFGEAGDALKDPYWQNWLNEVDPVPGIARKRV